MRNDSPLSTLTVTRIGSGPALLLAHGAGGGVALNFGQLIDEMAGERTLIGVDYPGSGASPLATSSYSVDDLADAIVDAGRAAGFDRFPIVGLSLGSAVAVTAALRHPEAVSALILTVGFAHADPQLRLVVDVWRYLAGHNRDMLARFLTGVSSPSAFVEGGNLDEVVADVRASIPVGSPQQAALAVEVDLRDRLADIAIPTLVVAAGVDRIVQPSSTRALAAGIPGSVLMEYPHAGHIFTPDEGRTWISDIRKFLLAHQL
ncbi:alpha/beta hydrolase [Mycolicibacterium sp. lyk4-40-TYG-92]|uniref:alpha/beta fold hydrolase n=1 Tax=Mycolicibacterium sp. lyk4-40-TYG-92 TaxID=3040295 RepID=UPI00254A673D|nr:alpha/beta hydrolase [Mycolicibacterium sp. lyk4-40-TYG-92]